MEKDDVLQADTGGDPGDPDDSGSDPVPEVDPKDDSEDRYGNAEDDAIVSNHADPCGDAGDRNGDRDDPERNSVSDGDAGNHLDGSENKHGNRQEFKDPDDGLSGSPGELS